MNSNSATLNALSIFQQGESKVKDIAKKYPWCSVAQLSLLHLYKKNNLQEFEQQASKTALFFNSNIWLNWQMHLLSEEEIDFKENNQDSKKETLTEDEQQDENIKKTLSDVAAQQNTDEDVIAFEPLHTTDYFASQGIKITEEPVANDKLGNQMKSFTEWLKSMKKLHTENLPAGDEQTDKNIQRLADHSNADAAIVTEAMAEVLIKQNKTSQAIEVYRKLSLQNPPKSDYFAAKIASLQSGGQV